MKWMTGDRETEPKIDKNNATHLFLLRKMDIRIPPN